MKNFAFIDAQNVHKGIKNLGWELDWKRLRVYLSEKYNIATAYIFVGYVPPNQDLYAQLQQAGYILIFKSVIYDESGKAQGNCDADLVLHAIVKKEKYDKFGRL